MQREGIFREMKLRGHYEKPSEKKAREKAEAVRRARKLARKKLQREGLLPMKPKPVFGAGPGARAWWRWRPWRSRAQVRADRADRILQDLNSMTRALGPRFCFCTRCICRRGGAADTESLAALQPFRRCILRLIGLCAVLDARFRCMAVTDCNALPLRFALRGRADRAACSRSRSAAARSIWDHGRSDRRSHRPSSRNRTGAISGQAPATPRATPRAARRWPNPERPKRRSRSSIARIDARSLQRAGPVRPRPALSGAKSSMSRRSTDFTAANGLTPQQVEPLLAPRDQLPRPRQGQGSRRRSRRGGAGRSAKRAGLDGTRACL